MQVVWTLLMCILSLFVCSSQPSAFNQGNTVSRIENLTKLYKYLMDPKYSIELNQMIHSSNFLSLENSNNHILSLHSLGTTLEKILHLNPNPIHSIQALTDFSLELLIKNAPIIANDPNDLTIIEWAILHHSVCKSLFRFRNRSQFKTLFSVFIHEKVYELDVLTKKNLNEKFVSDEELGEWINKLVNLEWDIELKAILRLYKKRLSSIKDKDEFISNAFIMLEIINTQLSKVENQKSILVLTEFTKDLLKYLYNYSPRHGWENVYIYLFSFSIRKNTNLNILKLYDLSLIPSNVKMDAAKVAMQNQNQEALIILKGLAISEKNRKRKLESHTSFSISENYRKRKLDSSIPQSTRSGTFSLHKTY